MCHVSYISMQLIGDLETKILCAFHFKSDRSKDRGTEWSRNLLYLSSCHLVEKIKETLGDLMLQTMGPLPLFGAEYLILYTLQHHQQQNIFVILSDISKQNFNLVRQGKAPGLTSTCLLFFQSKLPCLNGR